MPRQHAEVRAPRGGQAQHGTDAGYTGKRTRKPRLFVVEVVKCSLCHIRRTCVNGTCAVCAANQE